MTLGLALILLGLLLIWAGITGRSVKALLLGRIEPSKQPAPVTREQG